jgi:Ca2+-binding EF-hand superfamily protein
MGDLIATTYLSGNLNKRDVDSMIKVISKEMSNSMIESLLERIAGRAHDVSLTKRFYNFIRRRLTGTNYTKPRY